MNTKICLCEFLEIRLVVQSQDKERKLVTWPYLFEQ